MKKFFTIFAIMVLTVTTKAQTVLTAAELVYKEESSLSAMSGQQSKRNTPHTIAFSDQYLKKQMRQREVVLSTTIIDLKNRTNYFYLTDSENYYYVNEDNQSTFFTLGTYEKSTPIMKLSDDTATINGFNCKKAIFTYDINGSKEDIEVWYTPDYKLEASHVGYNFKELPGLPVLFKLKILNPIQQSMDVSGTREYSLMSIRELSPAEVPYLENKEKYKFLDNHERQNLFTLVNIHGTKNRPTPQNKGEATEETITTAAGTTIKVVKYNPFKVGQQLPDFKLKDVNGKKKSLDSYKGNVIVLNFWFTGCAPCIKEMPYLNSLAEKYKNDDIAFVSMTFNTQEEVKQFLKKQSFKFDHLTDAREIIEQYGVSSYPFTVIVDKNKVIQYIRAGEANEELEEQINKLKMEN